MLVRLDVEEIESLSDDEIRERVRQFPNGEYAAAICKNCGRIFTCETGSVDIAKILKVCNKCFVGGDE